MKMIAKVSCPKCGRKQPVRTPDALYWCDVCQCQFDNDPNEGGDYSDHDPSARLERQERLKQRPPRGPALGNRVHRDARRSY